MSSEFGELGQYWHR